MEKKVWNFFTSSRVKILNFVYCILFVFYLILFYDTIIIKEKENIKLEFS